MLLSDAFWLPTVPSHSPPTPVHPPLIRKALLPSSECSRHYSGDWFGTFGLSYPLDKHNYFSSWWNYTHCPKVTSPFHVADTGYCREILTLCSSNWPVHCHACFDCGVIKLTLTSPGSHCWPTVRLWPRHCVYGRAWSHTDHMKLTASNCHSLTWSSFLDLFQRLSLPSVFSSYLRS